jgi:hypothetical protein
MSPQLCCLALRQRSYKLLSLFIGEEVDCPNAAFVMCNVVLGNFDGEDEGSAHGVVSDQWTPCEHASGNEQLKPREMSAANRLRCMKTSVASQFQ